MSGIRNRLLDILVDINEPVSAKQIHERATVRWGVENISMALKSLARDGLIRIWQNGQYVHKGYTQEAPRPRKAAAAQKPVPRETIKEEKKVSQQSKEETIPVHNEGKGSGAIPPQLEGALANLEIRMRCAEVKDLDLKIKVLDRLSAIVETSIADVLVEIRDDVKTLAGAQ